MADFIFNIAKGRMVEFYNRVKSNDPANSAFVLIPVETSGLEADSVLRDADTVTAVFAGATNEQTVMGRKTLTDAELAALPAPDDTNDRYDLSLPTVLWTAPGGNPVAKLLLAFDSDTTGGTDANLIPCGLYDFPQTPNGVANIQLTGAVFFRAS